MSAADVSSDVAAIAPLLRLVHQWHHPDRELPPGRDCDACVAVIALDRLAARAAGRDDTTDVPRCGYCHWPFDSFESGCAQCTTGGVYSDARNAWRLANRAALDEAGEDG